MPPRQAILLVDHGSLRPEANDTLRDIARLVADLAGDDVIVRYAHMDLAAPTIAEGFASCVTDGADEVIVMPYMLAPGRHAQQDIPRLVADATRDHPGARYRIAPPLGAHPLLARIVLDRCEGAR